MAARRNTHDQVDPGLQRGVDAEIPHRRRDHQQIGFQKLLGQSIRTLMIAVAVVAVPLAAVSICRARAARFVRLAVEHQSQVQIGATPIPGVGWKTYQLTDLGMWHV